jgi:heme A synthase
LGIATGAVGVVLEALRPWLGVVYSLYGILLFAWLIWLALALWQLSGEPDSTLAT